MGRRRMQRSSRNPATPRTQRDCVAKAGPELLALDPHGLTVNVVDPDVDMSAVVAAPGSDLGATVSFWLDSLDARKPYERVLRHAVARPVSEGAPRWRGIVEEGLRAVEDLTDPMRYFSAGGSRDTLQHNVKRVMDDVATFLDLESVESYPTAEYIL